MAVSMASGAQKAKIHVLAAERGMDYDLLHSYVFQLTGKESIKKLNIMEAVKVIDGLSGRAVRALDPKGETLSGRQRKYLEDIAVSLGWVNEAGLNTKRLNAFCKAQYGKCSYTWLSRSEACKAITALKTMLDRERRRL